MHTNTLLLAVFGASSALALPFDLQAEAVGVDVRTVGKRTASAQGSSVDWAHGGDCASNNLSGCVGGHGEDADNATPHPVRADAEKRWTNPPSAIPVGFGTACSLETCDMCPTFPGCDTNSSGNNSDKGDNGDDQNQNDGDDVKTPPKSEEHRRWVNPITTLPTEFGTACSLETCDMCPSFPGCGSGEMKAGREPSPPVTKNWAQPPAAAVLEKRDVVEEVEDSATKPANFKKGNWEQPPTPQERREANISPIVVSGGVEIGAGPECSVFTCDLCPDHPGCTEGGQTWNDGDSEPPK